MLSELETRIFLHRTKGYSSIFGDHNLRVILPASIFFPYEIELNPGNPSLEIYINHIRITWIRGYPKCQTLSMLLSSGFDSEEYSCKVTTSIYWDKSSEEA